MTTGKVLLSMLAAAAAGAVIGVLFAPEKGVNTREKIVRNGEEKFNELISAISGTAPKGKGQKDAVRTPSSELVP